MTDLLVKIGKTLRYHAMTMQRYGRGAWWDMVRPPADRPIIELGCSRAGTTVVYKTLSQSPQLGTLQRETHDFDAADASAVDCDFATRYFHAWTDHSIEATLEWFAPLTQKWRPLCEVAV